MLNGSILVLNFEKRELDAPRRRRQRQGAAWLSLGAVGADRSRFRRAVPARPHAPANARTRCVLWQVPHRLPRRISRELVRTRQALAFQARLLLELLRRGREPTLVGMEKEGLDIRRIRAAGSSGIAGTTWAGGCPTRTPARSGAGRLSNATCRGSGNIASRVTQCAGHASARRSCTGPMTAGRSRSASPAH